MSSIGPGSFGAINLAGSIAGAQVNRTDTNEVKADASARKFQIDQRSMAAQKLDDVAETDYSGDRDPDGRRSFQQPNDGASDEPQDDATNQRSQSRRPADATGELGNVIDFEA
jgi:hypothetical protein